LSADEHVELLEGVIVAEPPQDPRHASVTTRVNDTLRRLLGDAAVVRVQMPLTLGPYSAPEPDVAVVEGPVSRYDDAHPQSALLVVEVAGASLPKDRLSKSRIYAVAGIPDYWLINLRDECVEVFTTPDLIARCYSRSTVAARGDRLELSSFPGLVVEVDDLLP
jgi:Uma2 family endonuclease